MSTPPSNPFTAWLRWLESPSGAQLIAAEQGWFDRRLADAFGYKAVALAPPHLEPLRTNRMAGRGTIQLYAPLEPHPPSEVGVVVCSPDALPFESESLDLLVLAHALEQVEDPHALLREAERVLIPEGRLVVVGLNPHSLWALHRPEATVSFPPISGRWISSGRIRDWCKLLGLSVDQGELGIYRPVCRTPTWWNRLAWLEPAGARWWPMLGAIYWIGAVKRKAGLRVISPTWRTAGRRPKGTAVVTPTQAHREGQRRVA
ncbi:MAG: SAM-dependent methyltransferase [Betaproteobacteria bacterium]|nr:SAM-dependent methyltransferase [Betaproteobacteria bacterium]